MRLSDGSQLWITYLTGEVIGSPQIVGDRVYLVVWDTPTDQRPTQGSFILCLNINTGALEWQYAIPDARVGSLTVQNSVVVVPGRARRSVSGFNAATGALLWTTPLLEDNRFSTLPPAIAGGRVYLSDEKHFYALDVHSGAQLWRLDTDYLGKPFDNLRGAMVATGDRVYLVGFHPESSHFGCALYAVNPTTGQFLWSNDLPGYDTVWGISYHQGVLFAAAGWEENGYHTGIIAVDALNGSQRWRTGTGIYDVFPPAIGSNSRLLVTGDSDAWLLDEGNGRILWSNNDTFAAGEWKAGFDIERSEWMPAQWGLDVNGDALLLTSLYGPMGLPPVMDGGIVFSLSDARPPHLAAFGPDTSPPFGEIRLPAQGKVLGRDAISVYGTAYDFNLASWSLEVGAGRTPSVWRKLAGDSSPRQGDMMMLDQLGRFDPASLGVGDFVLRLVLTDKAGNLTTITHELANDFAPPSITITWPVEGQLINSETFTITGTASDDLGVASVNLRDEAGLTNGPATGTTNWEFPVTITSAMTGKSVTFDASATDRAGKTAMASVTVQFPDVQVKLGQIGRQLTSNYSIFVDPNNDIDGDGIDQRFENTALELITPYLELDEEEDWLDQFGTPVSQRTKYPMALFARVTPYTPPVFAGRELPGYILFYYAFGWSKDWGAAELGFSDIAEAHRGDPEGMVYAWKVMDKRTLQLEWVTTSAHTEVNQHRGVWNAWDRACTKANIAKPKFGASYPQDVDSTEVMCESLRFAADGRLIMMAEEDKHAIYPSKAICEGISLVAPGYHKDCGWDPLNLPGQWEDSDFSQDSRYKGGGIWLFDVYNAGEPDPQRRFQLIDFLDQPATWRGLTNEQVMALTGLYPNEAVWSGRNRAQWNPDGTLKREWDSKNHWWNYFDGSDFCGGLDDTWDEPEACSGKLGGQLGMSGTWGDTGPSLILTSRLDTRYQVTITTGGIEKAGTDALISIQLLGDQPGVFTFVDANPQPQVVAPLGPAVGSYERGDTDLISIYESRDLGELHQVFLSQDESGDSSGWYVERILVTRMTDGKTWVSTGGRWLASDELPDNSTSAYFDLTAAPVETIYQVSIATDSREGSGTDADVSITLNGANGSIAGPFNLDNPDKDDFEHGNVDTFYVTGPELGALQTLNISLSTGEGDAPWLCQTIVVRDLFTGTVQEFPVNQWLPDANGNLWLTVSPP